MLEAVNENRSGCFGWAVEQALANGEEEAGTGVAVLRPEKGACTHHHRNKRNLVGKSVSTPPHPPTATTQSKIEPPTGPPNSKSWTWLPSRSLLAHYTHSLVPPEILRLLASQNGFRDSMSRPQLLFDSVCTFISRSDSVEHIKFTTSCHAKPLLASQT